VFGACSGTRFAPRSELVSASDLTYGTASGQVLERRAAHGCGRGARGLTGAAGRSAPVNGMSAPSRLHRIRVD